MQNFKFTLLCALCLVAVQGVRAEDEVRDRSYPPPLLGSADDGIGRLRDGFRYRTPAQAARITRSRALTRRWIPEG